MNPKDVLRHHVTGAIERGEAEAVSAVQSMELKAPSYWACYLINGDSSGMEQSEIDACDGWIDSLGMGAPVDAHSAEEFVRSHDAWQFSPFAGSVMTYTFWHKE